MSARRLSTAWPTWTWLGISIACLIIAVSPYLTEAILSTKNVDSIQFLLMLGVGVFAAMRSAASPATRGMVEVVFILWITMLFPVVTYLFSFYTDGLPVTLPRLFRGATGFLTFVWPQMVFFGARLVHSEPRAGLVLPSYWAGAFSVAFWLVIGGVVAAMLQHVEGRAVRVAAAVVVVSATTLAVRAIIPWMGWRSVIELP